MQQGGVATGAAKASRRGLSPAGSRGRLWGGGRELALEGTAGGWGKLDPGPARSSQEASEGAACSLQRRRRDRGQKRMYTDWLF